MRYTKCICVAVAIATPWLGLGMAGGFKGTNAPPATKATNAITLADLVPTGLPKVSGIHPTNRPHLTQPTAVGVIVPCALTNLTNAHYHLLFSSNLPSGQWTELTNFRWAGPATWLYTNYFSNTGPVGFFKCVFDR